MTCVTFAPILLAKAYHMVTLIFTGGRGLLGKDPEYLNRSSVPVPKLLFQFLIFKKIPRFWDLFMMLSVHIGHYFSQLRVVRHMHIPHLTYYSPRIRPLLFPAPDALHSWLWPPLCVAPLDPRESSLRSECTQKRDCWVSGYRASPSKMRHILNLPLFCTKRF